MTNSPPTMTSTAEAEPMGIGLPPTSRSSIGGSPSRSIASTLWMPAGGRSVA